MFNRLCIITFILLGLLSQSATAQYKITDNLLLAWEALLDLRINTARLLVNNEITQNPNNYYAYYLAQNCDAFELMINNTTEAYIVFEANYENRREIMDDIDIESPYYLGCKSEMQFQMGIFNIIHGDKLTGLRRAYNSYKNTYKNLDDNPDFQPSKKLDGIFNVALSNLPPFVSWAAGAFGISGDDKIGFNILNNYFDYCANTPGLKQEAILYTILAHKLNKDPYGAYNFIKSLDSNNFNYRLLKYFYANIAYRSGKNEEALSIFSTFKRETLEIQFNPYNYLYGKIMLRKLDSSAIKYLEKYLVQTREKDYLKEMHYQLALAYLITDNKNEFSKHKQLAGELGDDITERDREAIYDYSLDYIPDPMLVKARLLLEGGYYNRAKQIINSYTMSDETPTPYLLEYYSLNGKLNYFTENYKQAITVFNKVIDLGNDEDYYFAAESAMYLGFIYEKTDTEKAISYFTKARELYNPDYYDYIDEISKKRINLKDDGEKGE